MKLGRNYKAVPRERFLWPTHQHLAALRPALTCSASSSSMFFRSPVCSTCAWRGWLSTRAALLRDEAAPLAVTKRPAAGRPHAPHRPHWGLAHLKQVGLLEGGADVLHDLAPHRAHQALVAKLVKHAAGIGLPPGGGEAISDQLPRTATLTPRCWPPLLGGHASMSPDDSVTNINVGTDVQMHVQYRWLLRVSPSPHYSRHGRREGCRASRCSASRTSAASYSRRFAPMASGFISAGFRMEAPDARAPSAAAPGAAVVSSCLRLAPSPRERLAGGSDIMGTRRGTCGGLPVAGERAAAGGCSMRRGGGVRCACVGIVLGGHDSDNTLTPRQWCW